MIDASACKSTTCVDQFPPGNQLSRASRASRMMASKARSASARSLFARSIICSVRARWSRMGAIRRIEPEFGTLGALALRRSVQKQGAGFRMGKGAIRRIEADRGTLGSMGAEGRSPGQPYHRRSHSFPLSDRLGFSPFRSFVSVASVPFPDTCANVPRITVGSVDGRARIPRLGGMHHLTNVNGHRLGRTAVDPLPFPSDAPEPFLWSEPFWRLFYAILFPVLVLGTILS